MAKKIKLSRKQAIKDFCCECNAYQKKLVRGCLDYSCPLFPFRMGTPNTENYIPLTPRQRQKGM